MGCESHSASLRGLRGNLINDGSKDYVYDQANQLTAVSRTGLSWSAAYNSDGARPRTVVNGTPTTYTQDLASPLPVVLQATTGSASTQYVFGMGTRPLAEYDSAWEYLLPDGLGSVRQLVDAGGNVKLTESYEPYGSVLSSQGSATSAFGFTGEQFDSYIELMFLRARYMQPTLGMFLSRDPWSGDALRPGSMNGWNYVACRPINSVDPSGRIPEPKFGPEDYEYSCNCGWIDWRHADSRLAKDIMKKIKDAQGRRNGLTPGTSVVSVAQGDMFGTISGDIEVSTDLGERTTLMYNVSLGIYMDLQDLLEKYQSGHSPILYPLPINISGFSQEDLVSDLLGFYIAYQEDNPNPHPHAKESVRRICSVVGLDEPHYQQKQLLIYIKHAAMGFKTNKDWFNPIVDCSVCKPDTGVLRDMFSHLSPIGPSVTGPWRWNLAMACNNNGLLFCRSYSTDSLNNRWWK